uniref:AMP-binding enzyme n=1 Tax=Corynebacterium variabile TaxID=1727 RepID=UPI00406C8D4D
DAGVGRVALHGPSVADGYRVTGSLDPAVAADAFPAPGVFCTSDLGRVEGGVLTVLGRADGAVNSGGLKILPEQVEAAVASVGLSCCAVGVPDDEWGEIVAVLVESGGAESAAGTDCTASLRARMKDADVASHLIPRRAFTTGVLPLTGPGKLDRRTVRGVLQELVRGTSGD